MTKHILYSLIVIIAGFGFLYWSGLISETTSDNWQGETGIILACLGGALLVIPFIWYNVVEPIMEKFD